MALDKSALLELTEALSTAEARGRTKLAPAEHADRCAAVEVTALHAPTLD